MIRDIDESDLELIERAKAAINRNYDSVKHYHTVGSALRCRNGKIYEGVNCDGIHGSCAEFIAAGAAISAGERDFDCITAVYGANKGNCIVPPCGNCRQMLFEYSPSIDVIIQIDGKPMRIPITELLPFPYIDTL